NFENGLRWTQKVGWDYRAHTLLWGGNDNHSMPDWVRNLPTPQDIVDTCRMRVVRDVTRYRGILKEYDVINEPLTGHADWLRNTVGDSIIWESYKWAREADPDAELYINDYNVEYNWGQAIEYRDLILEMLDNGAPVTGIGMQSHYWDCCRPNVNELVHNVNILAETGLPIKFTEYDYGGNLSQAEQAADYIMVLTIAFSHPSIVGMYHWSLRDGWSWRENAGFFDTQGKPKLAADTLLYFTRTKWATHFDTITDLNDPLMFNAYHGTYTVEAEFDGVKKVFKLPLLKAYSDSIFILHEEDARLKGPQLLYAELREQNEIALMFDKPMDDKLLRRSDFKFFSPGNIGIEAVALDVENPDRLLISLSTDVNPGTYIAVSYFPGSLMAADGSVAGAFGPVALANELQDDTHVAELRNSALKVYPNPAVDQVSIAFDSAPFSIHVYNSSGNMVYTAKSFAETTHIDLSNLSKGVYFVRLTDAQNTMYVEKLIVK
ncbi:MAG: endo-1,4-beta-xylanase, partial [Bacteroidota bacterium]